MRKLLILLMCLLPMAALAEAPEEALPIYDYAFSGKMEVEHASPSLWWRIESFREGEAQCYLTKVCMADPGRQIGKVAAEWEVDTARTEDLARKAPDASLIINASGYVTPIYRWIPENYPGESSDYYYTPLGSLTVTDGQVYRHLEGVPYYGLTLNEDGLRMHVGQDPADVLDEEPSQTWSFYVECPVIRDHRSILDPMWNFSYTKAMRTIIARMDDHNYAILTVTSKGRGLTMQECVAWLQANLAPEWAYNLDGGPSSALMYHTSRGKLKTMWRSEQDNADIMTFSELPEE